MTFATLFDRNYIPRAAVMIDSLISQMGNEFSKIFVLSLDQEVVTYFEGNPIVDCIPLAEVEDFFPELLRAKSNRSFVEYIFTLSPFFPLYLLRKFPELKRITSLDSDLYFFSSPLGVLEALGKDKIGITAHNFPFELKHLEIYGKYNVSFQSFPNTEIGINCLMDWADDCLQFCGDFLDEKGRFADQKYLDNWEKQYELVEVFPSPEIGLAPWNVYNQDLRLDDEGLFFEKRKIVFYHFQGLRIRSKHRFLLGLSSYCDSKVPSFTILKFYQLYIKLLFSVGSGTSDRINRLQLSVSRGLKSIIDDSRIQPIFFKMGPFFNYTDLRKFIDFAENKLKITYWK